MKLTLGEMSVIIDTLVGSLQVNDNCTVWKYTNKTRDAVAQRLIRDQSLVVNLDTQETGEMEVKE